LFDFSSLKLETSKFYTLSSCEEDRVEILMDTSAWERGSSSLRQGFSSMFQMVNWSFWLEIIDKVQVIELTLFLSNPCPEDDNTQSLSPWERRTIRCIQDS
jgi:hypothetical protein